MKYIIELSVRSKGVQLLSLNEDEKEQLLDEDLNEVYLDWIAEKDYDFALEAQYLMYDCDRFRLTIKDENNKVVYETDNPRNLNDRSVDEDGEPINGWEFLGVEDGIYLTRLQTIKDSFVSGTFELDEPFDKDRLYIIKDTEIDDELMGDDVFPLDTIYYQRGESMNVEEDVINLDFDDDMGEQYYDTYLMRVKKKNLWQNLQEDDE